jgi:hypothetical protein
VSDHVKKYRSLLAFIFCPKCCSGKEIKIQYDLANRGTPSHTLKKERKRLTLFENRDLTRIFALREMKQQNGRNCTMTKHLKIVGSLIC